MGFSKFEQKHPSFYGFVTAICQGFGLMTFALTILIFLFDALVVIETGAAPNSMLWAFGNALSIVYVPWIAILGGGALIYSIFFHVNKSKGKF
ncbi:hypothetical protein KAR91_85870 [Candidatus Pacearchaeota archaeon]|nr:hypothetical protein [Candidatus Pacearchaeota archaeon]